MVGALRQCRVLTHRTSHRFLLHYPDLPCRADIFPTLHTRFCELMLPDGTRIICMIWHMLPGLDLCYADPAQPLRTAGEELDDLDHDLSVRGVN